MPAVFEAPGETDPQGRTQIRGLAGSGTVFDPALTTAVDQFGRDLPDGTPSPAIQTGGMAAGTRVTPSPRGVGLSEITDGTSNTVFVAIARDATVWTRPGELPFVPGQDLPALDESAKDYILGMCDGSVRLLKKGGSPASFTALLTRAGGEVVSTDVFADAAVRPAARADGSTSPPTNEAPGSSSVEHRLQKLEEKVDRILEKLDAL